MNYNLVDKDWGIHLTGVPFQEEQRKSSQKFWQLVIEKALSDQFCAGMFSLKRFYLRGRRGIGESYRMLAQPFEERSGRESCWESVLR